MESHIINSPVCEICQKEFISVSVKNRHLRKIHNEDIQNEKNQHILCCLCLAENRDKFSSYKNYENHLRTIHNIFVKENDFHFTSREEFEAWRRQENRGVDYAFIRTCNTTKGDTVVYYKCNRSDHRGYESVCKKRKRKIGGSIQIQGVCPSRISVKISTDGLYTVTLVETHVGHDDDLRTKRLSKYPQNLRIKELTAGIPNNNSIMDEPSGSKLRHQDELNHFMQKIQHDENQTSLNIDEETRKIAEEEFIGFINQLSGDDLKKFLSEVWHLKSRMGKDNEICKKKKVENQSYSPKKE